MVEKNPPQKKKNSIQLFSKIPALVKTNLSDALPVKTVACRASISCLFLFFFFFFFSGTELSSAFELDSHSTGVVPSASTLSFDFSLSGWDVKLHIPPSHHSSSWLDGSKCKIHSSFSLFLFFFFFFRFFSFTNSTVSGCVTVIVDTVASALLSTSECRRFFFFFFFFWVTSWAKALLTSCFWTTEVTLPEDALCFVPIL